jgi:copper chaperone CopZ
MSATTETVTLAVTGMTCGSCKRHVEQALARVEGVVSAEVDVAAGRATVAFDAGVATVDRMVEAVREAGYGAEPAAPAECEVPAAGAKACACCAPAPR